MLDTQFKTKYYRVEFLNYGMPVYKYFYTRKTMIEFINLIGKDRVLEVVFMRELNVVEDNK